MEQYRSYTDPQDENDVTNKRYVDKNIDDQIKKVENDIDNRFKKSLGNIIVDSIENKNIFNVDLALSVSQVGCNAHIIEDGIRLISNSDTTNDVYAIYRTIDLRGLEGKQFVLSYKTRSNKSVTSSLGGIELFYENAAGNDRTLIEWNATNGFSFQVKDNLGNNYYLAMTFFANRTGNQIYNNEYVDYYDIQIEEGSKATSYTSFKRYGYNNKESMGKIVVDDIRSKNFFDVNKITSTTVNGVTISKNANGGLVLNGTATGQIEFFYVELVSESKIKPGKTYTLSSNALPQDDKLQVFLQNSNSATWVSTIANIKGTINPDTFTVSTLPGTHFKFLILILKGATLNNFVLYPQIEEGSTATNYSEYKGIGYTSGRNANGSWVKYDDGRMECWGVKSYNNVEVNVLDITEYYGALPAQPFPQAFISSPICMMSIDNVQPGYALELKSTGIGATGTHTPMTLAFCAASITATRIDVHYHAIGYWK